MGATYISIQVPDTSRDVIRTALTQFNATSPVRLAAYLGQPIGRWTALYPRFSPETDRFAKILSGAAHGPVLTLGSIDEDDLLCNFCVAGKDLSFFKVNVGAQRKGKQRVSVIKKIDALQAFADEPSRAALVDRLCDTRHVTFGSEILADFCAVFAIKNARTSFDYIERDDYRDDLDVDTSLERID